MEKQKRLSNAKLCKIRANIIEGKYTDELIDIIFHSFSPDTEINYSKNGERFPLPVTRILIDIKAKQHSPQITLEYYKKE